MLLITSPLAGEYECPLVGGSMPPRPQGPFDLAHGAGTVPFKNVFWAASEFAYGVDNAAFTVRAGDALPAKKAAAIAVAFRDAAGAAKRTACLTVTCPARCATPWVFYLRAV